MLCELSASHGMADCDKSSNLAGTSSVSVTKPATAPSSQSPPSSSTPIPSSPPPPPPSLSASAVQCTSLKASNIGTYDEFGSSVALNGDMLVVGALYEDNSATGVNGDQTNNSVTHSGAVYVFARSGSPRTQQIYVEASKTGP